MKLFRRTFLHLAAGAAALPAVAHIARAQTYPTQPVRVIVPFAAGGPSDYALARSERLWRNSSANPLSSTAGPAPTASSPSGPCSARYPTGTHFYLVDRASFRFRC
jgi:hypothetical protein